MSLRTPAKHPSVSVSLRRDYGNRVSALPTAFYYDWILRFTQNDKILRILFIGVFIGNMCLLGVYNFCDIIIGIKRGKI